MSSDSGPQRDRPPSTESSEPTSPEYPNAKPDANVSASDASPGFDSATPTTSGGLGKSENFTELSSQYSASANPPAEAAANAPAAVVVKQANDSTAALHAANEQAKAKRYFCKVCNQGFTRKHNMVSHELIHSSLRPFICSVCDLKFRRIHDLKRHEKLHTGEKPFECEKCGRQFARPDAMTRHQQSANACSGSDNADTSTSTPSASVGTMSTAVTTPSEGDTKALDVVAEESSLGGTAAAPPPPPPPSSRDDGIAANVMAISPMSMTSFNDQPNEPTPGPVPAEEINQKNYDLNRWRAYQYSKQHDRSSQSSSSEASIARAEHSQPRLAKRPSAYNMTTTTTTTITTTTNQDPNEPASAYDESSDSADDRRSEERTSQQRDQRRQKHELQREQQEQRRELYEQQRRQQHEQDEQQQLQRSQQAYAFPERAGEMPQRFSGSFDRNTPPWMQVPPPLHDKPTASSSSSDSQYYEHRFPLQRLEPHHQHQHQHFLPPPSRQHQHQQHQSQPPPPTPPPPPQSGTPTGNNVMPLRKMLSMMNMAPPPPPYRFEQDYVTMDKYQDLVSYTNSLQESLSKMHTRLQHLESESDDGLAHKVRKMDTDRT
ncbi:hypothetical protein ABC855_g2580 [[Candida] zeylanoides]